MARGPRPPAPATPAPSDVDWSVTVVAPLPHCPSVAAAWERIATQTRWSEWRSESKIPGSDASTSTSFASTSSVAFGGRPRRARPEG